MFKYTTRIWLTILVSLCLCVVVDADAAPVLHFSDLTYGPQTGNSDGVGSGAIVTIWGVGLGSTQGASKVYVGNVEATAVYYWKNADGTLPGGPANLYAYHKMQEVCFSVPVGASDGVNTIKVVVGGVDSNTLPFTVGSGDIFFVKSTGNDSTGTGSWSNPWLTLNNVLAGGNGKLTPGDIVYDVGVGTSTIVQVGSGGTFTDTSETTYSVAVYPNTASRLIGTDNSNGSAAVRNYDTLSTLKLVFSKFSITCLERAFSPFRAVRIVGNNVTGPNVVGSSNAGWIGGSCNGKDVTICGGAKFLGNEVYNYGKSDGTTSVFHHLYYLSNRSGSSTPAYEIGWNYHHDNYAYQGIHIYDQAPCGGWSGVLKIHHNVVKNQAGNAVNINVNCSETNAYEIYNNVTIVDVGFTPPSNGAPLAAFRVTNNSASTAKIYNNTSYGYGAGVNLSSGINEFRNNIIVDNRNISYSVATPTSDSNNLFYSVANPELALPDWAAGELNENPMFVDAGTYDLSVAPGSPAINAGTDLAGTLSDDLTGNIRALFDIGAYEFVGADITTPVITISPPDPKTVQAATTTLTGTASDAGGVSSCKYRPDAAPDGDNGTACSGSTSWSCNVTGLSMGANTVYVGCADPSSNWGSDSLTVNREAAAVVGRIVGGMISGGVMQ